MPANKLEKQQAELKARDVKALFEQLVPDEDTAVDFLFHELQWRGLVRCKRCEGRQMERIRGARDMFCLNCKRLGWFTAGGFFDHAKHIRPWLLYFAVRHQGITLSANAFADLAQIEFSSSSAMKRKVDMAVLDFKPDDSATISSGAFLDVVCKRSRLTPAEGHPKAEEEKDNDQSPDEIAAPQNLPKNQQVVFNCLGSEPISVDHLLIITGLPIDILLSSLVTLQLDNLAEELPGDFWTRAQATKIPVLEQIPWALRNRFIDFIQTYFHGISRKYLQPYLARFWIHTDRARWNGRTILTACLEKGQVKLKQLLAYKTPPAVHLIDTTPRAIGLTVSTVT